MSVIYDTAKISVFALNPWAIESIRDNRAPSYVFVEFDDADAYRKDPDWLLVADGLPLQVRRPTVENATTGAVAALKAEAAKIQAETGKRLTDIDRKINQLLAITNEVPV